MKMIKAAVAATALFLLSTAADAADYQYLNARTNTHWRSDLLAWLVKEKSDPANVSIGITADGDIHAYAVQGQFTGIYAVQRLSHPTDRANNTLRAIVDGGTGRIIGFGLRKPANEKDDATKDEVETEGKAEQGASQGASKSRFVVYVLTWTKQ
jgi:hypothetical protein